MLLIFSNVTPFGLVDMY